MEDILNCSVDESPESATQGISGDIINTEGSEEVFKTPGLIISDLKTSLSSYFAPNAKTRIARGEQFKVKARRLTLNGDIAYLIDWDNPGQASALDC